MIVALFLLFLFGYACIVFEHSLRLDKLATALGMGVLMWTLLALGFQQEVLQIMDTHGTLFTFTSPADGSHQSGESPISAVLLHHIGKIAEIMIFLIGAMTMVELIDLHKGFEVIRGWIATRNKRKLLWITGILAFVLSAIIDNLTTTIVLISILRKLVPSREERIWYVALIITAANAGGAWSPIGDVTTTMLWIGGKLTTEALIAHVGLPSLVCFVVPYVLATRRRIFQGELHTDADQPATQFSLLQSSKPMLFSGLLLILFVPVFKTLTHLPPYAGMMLSLSILWGIATYLPTGEKEIMGHNSIYSPFKALAKIEMSSILFFLGILLAIAAFETVAIDGMSMLRYGAEKLSTAIPNQNVIAVLLGVISAIIDNVPLVAAAMGMYTMPPDSAMWHFIAYTAGTGGSLLVVGSAAGVAAMGMEKIDFIWYLRNITLLTLAGYLAGCAVFILF